ncbi:MAG: AAA family ATPase [Nitrososphaerota archaeon]|nr:AAA family ATPase [Nitrososphaerota archaeon]
MKIESIRVINYKSHQDTGQILLSPGMNLIVGSNNAGKSALLEALGLRFSGRPHRSESAIPHPDDSEAPTSTVLVRATGSGMELKRVFLRATSVQYFPFPASLPFNEPTVRRIVNELFTANKVDLSLSYTADGRGPAIGHGDGETPVLWPQLPRPPQFNRIFQLAPSSDRRNVGSIALNISAPSTLGEIAAQSLLEHVFRLNAERMKLGSSRSGTSTVLQADGSNLPEVVLELWNNTGRFRQYETLVKEVFPFIQAITVKHTNNDHIEIRVTPVETDPQRGDLAFPLAECGTGIGQVLALLYIVVASHDPQIVLIDEPNSFLHPSASRALIRILRQFPSHQYVIATHAPEVIAEAGDCPVLRISWNKGQSVCKLFSVRDLAVNRQLLTDVGARLSDVFGFDSVLWVEGPSDQMCFTVVINAKIGPIPGLTVMPVRDTGSFERRKASDIVAIYKQASMGSALLPTTVGFLLDQDGRAPADMQRAIADTKGAVSFLQRRMLENYLLNPVVISEIIVRELGDAESNVTSTTVEQWLRAHGMESKYLAESEQFGTPAWLNHMHGGRLLYDLFADLTNAKLEFKKTRHCVLMVQRLLELEPDFLDPLVGELKGKLADVQGVVQ